MLSWNSLPVVCLPYSLIESWVYSLPWPITPLASSFFRTRVTAAAVFIQSDYSIGYRFLRSLFSKAGNGNAVGASKPSRVSLPQIEGNLLHWKRVSPKSEARATEPISFLDPSPADWDRDTSVAKARSVLVPVYRADELKPVDPASVDLVEA